VQGYRHHQRIGLVANTNAGFGKADLARLVGQTHLRHGIDFDLAAHGQPVRALRTEEFLRLDEGGPGELVTERELGGRLEGHRNLGAGGCNPYYGGSLGVKRIWPM
jgi:hypothetical protein